MIYRFINIDVADAESDSVQLSAGNAVKTHT